jgi:signal transduction histidine kinase
MSPMPTKAPELPEHIAPGGAMNERGIEFALSDLAHVERVMTLGALTASIAHEVNQPLSGIIINATTCLSMLAANPPNIDGARATLQRALCDGNRASEVITRLRAMFARKHATNESFDLNEAASDVLALSSNELQVCRAILRTDFDADLPPVSADRIQIQQVILNLILNAADAMRTVDDRPRNLLIVTALEDANWVRLSVRDSGAGIDPQHLDKLFDAFFTTKPNGMGVGLSISRSIIESHKGRLWATANNGPGATFSLSIPCGPDCDVSRRNPHPGVTTR